MSAGGTVLRSVSCRLGANVDNGLWRVAPTQRTGQRNVAGGVIGIEIPAIQMVQQGALYWTTVDVVDIESWPEGDALRAALDLFNVLVRRFLIGQARHLLSLLSGDEPTGNYVILACHGVDGGIVLPELAEQFEAMQPVHRLLTPAALRDRVHLPERVVISTGCGTGNPELAGAFLDGGCTAYIAPTGGPYGNSVMVAIALLFYELMRGRTLSESMSRVCNYDDELSMWQLWERDRSSR